MINQLKQFCVAIAFCGFVLAKAEANEELMSQHPQHSYTDVENIEDLEEVLRKALVNEEKYSFSRGWWRWDRLRQRYVDSGRKEENSLRILRDFLYPLIQTMRTRPV